MRKHNLKILEVCEKYGLIGSLDDGFQMFWMPGQGALSANELRTIADELDRRNAPLQKDIEKWTCCNTTYATEIDYCNHLIACHPRGNTDLAIGLYKMNKIDVGIVVTDYSWNAHARPIITIEETERKDAAVQI